MDSVLTCLVSDQIGPGAVSEEASQVLNEKTGCCGCLFFREYERTIEIALSLLEIQEGDEFILSPLVPAAYLRALKKTGLVPVFIDPEPHAAVPDLDDIQDKVNERTRGILFYGHFGYQWDFAEWEVSGIKIIEDITQNFGSLSGDFASGSVGDIVIMRMEADDLITSGGGTALMVREKSDFSLLEEEIRNYDRSVLLPDMNAALALVQMKEFEKSFELRRELHELFLSSLMKSRHGYLNIQDEGKAYYGCMPVLINGKVKEIQAYGLKKNIETTLAFKGCCLEEGNTGEFQCPEAETLVLNCILFPLYPSLGRQNSDLISRVLATLP